MDPGMMGGMMGMCPNMMGGGMMGQGMMNINHPRMQKFLDETKDLRRELLLKKFEYSEAMRDPETSPETLVKLLKEKKAIMLKLYEKAPIFPPFGR
jgi:hypothetical protein